MNPIEAAERAGIDLSLIDESLRLTPEQRALQHDAALALVLQLESLGQQLRNGPVTVPVFDRNLRVIGVEVVSD
jgi:hypothetical protein